METIKWAVNEMPKTDDSQLQVMSLENVAKARAFHESFPQYSVTPLSLIHIPSPRDLSTSRMPSSA